jgi:hypothetical protein
VSATKSRSATACIAWRRLDSPGHDAAVLHATDGGWRLDGAAAFLEAGVPSHLRYTVIVDARWQSRSVLVEGWSGPLRVDLRIAADAERRWTLDGVEAPAVAGAVDVDLAFTPATNLLPIRRLDLAIGASSPVDAAWLPFPELDLRPLDQVYHRAARDTYHYASSGGSFRATLSVAASGFVTRYPGLWIQERG